VTNELKIGSVVPIPCRHCAQVCIRFMLTAGEHAVTCPRCGNRTAVRVAGEGPNLLVFTESFRAVVRPPARG
jgi:hypothetical protein